jgi:hypothetical protein
VNVPQHVRAYIYRIATVLATIAVLKGWVGAEEAPLLLELVAAVVAIGTPALAAANTPRHPEQV